MKGRKTILYACLVFLSLYTGAQTSTPVSSGNMEDTAAIQALIQEGKKHFADSPDLAFVMLTQAQERAEKAGFLTGQALALKTIGVGYFNQGKFMEAISYWDQAMKIYETLNDYAGLSNMLSNKGGVYFNEGDDEKALQIFLKSLSYAEKGGSKERMIRALTNIGAVYFHKKATHDKALDYYKRALLLGEELEDKYAIGGITLNIGEIYYERKNYKEALAYFRKSLKAFEEGSPENIPPTLTFIGKVYASQNDFERALNYQFKAYNTSKKLNSSLDMVQSLLGIAATYSRKGDARQALHYYSEAENVAITIKAKQELKQVYESLARLYAEEKDFSNAFKYQLLLADVKDDIYNADMDKRLAVMELDFNLQQKQGEVNLLTKDKNLKEVQLKKEKLARNALMAGLGLVFVIAFILFRNYREKVRINKVLDHQKEQIESLLLNILPAEVAKELQDTGTSKPRHYDNVSVLFTDFKSFTTLADKMSPQELVAELNGCFMAFDNIIEKYNLEKIKTIGDSYMCAGGIPTPQSNHALQMVEAALEIQEYVGRNNELRKAKGQEPWDIRIGVHVGPVVAGVVGKKKYAYDIWGSTVNIASRMESSGVPGMVNVSKAFYDAIRDNYTCTYRGKIHAKNVGDIDMYLVNHPVADAIEKVKVESLLQ